MSKRFNSKHHKRPVTIKNSYGIACCRYNVKEKRMEILMVKKRYTFYFVEFIMGHYIPSDESGMIYLFNRISNEEKVVIESMDFDCMWRQVWREIPQPATQEYTWFQKCKRKFDTNFATTDAKQHLRWLLSQSTSMDCMWEIPKGKRNPGETELSCALREWTEETGISSTACHLLGDEMEMQYSNNKATYHNKYFLAISINKSHSVLDQRYKVRSKVPRLSFNDARQISEIIDVRWMSLVEIKFLDQTHRFSQIISNMFKLIRSRYKLPKLAEHKELGLIS